MYIILRKWGIGKRKQETSARPAMLASILALMLAVPQAVSAEPQEDAQLLVVNESTVAFAGHEWWVIGDGTSGVNPQQDTLTLLAKQDEFGKSVFRTGHGNEFEGSTYDSANKMYYANNPDGTSWVAPTEYAGSTLQLKMDAIALSSRRRNLRRFKTALCREAAPSILQAKMESQGQPSPKNCGPCPRKSGRSSITIPSGASGISICSAPLIPITAGLEKPEPTARQTTLILRPWRS